MKKESKNRGNRNLFIILGVIFGVILIYSLIVWANQSPISNSPNTQGNENKNSCQDVQVPYQDTEYYTESEPYTSQECDNVPLKYTRDTTVCANRQNGFMGIGTRPASVVCDITNMDSIGGTFSVNLGFNVQGQALSEMQQKYIYPQKTESFEFTRDVTFDTCFCNEINIPTQQICHDVIKYHDVQKSRIVTKYRTEQQCS